MTPWKRITRYLAKDSWTPFAFQAVDHFLISSKEGPLWLFSPQLIGKLTDSELSKIAGESLQTVAHRARLTEEIANLREGQNILEG